MWKRRDRKKVTRRQRPSTGWRSQRGAVLVEAAIVMPVVLTLLLGVIEFGFIWKDELAMSSTVRSSARIGSADGVNASADYDILQQIKSGLSGITIKKVIVFEANASGTVPAACLNITPLTGLGKAGIAGVCNVYGPYALNLAASAFNCATSTTSPDWYWCPNTVTPTTNGPRVDARAGNGPDYLGVYVQINHPYVTKILGSSKDMSDTTTLRIEPTN